MAEASDVRLKRESDAELYFAHSPLAPLLFVAIGGAVMYVASIADRPPPWWMYLFLAVFPAFGLLGVFWRLELRLDLLTRRYHLRRGFWPVVSVREGQLDELQGVILERKWRRRSSRSRSSEYVVWSVFLDFGGSMQPISVFTSRREEEARARVEQLARRLSVAAVDRTGRTETVRSHEELDRPLRARRGGLPTPVSTTPPTDSGITLTAGATGRIIILPPMRLGIAAIFFLLFGFVFSGFSLLALGAALEVVPSKVSGSHVALATVASLFLLFGVAIMLLPVLAARAREHIEERGHELVFGTLLLGRKFGEKRLRRDRIEEIDIRDSMESRGASGRELFVRSDQTVVALGRSLDAEGVRWLRDTLLAMTLR